MLQERLEAKPIAVSFTINGRAVSLETMPNRTLLEMVRDDLALTGSKEGCGTGDCGACTMIVDGATINGCIMLAPQVDGKTVVTVEGIAEGKTLHPVQQAFVEAGAAQCGFCTPGFIMSSVALLERNPNPTEEEIRIGISGNICRCTGYVKIVDAVAMAARRMQSA